MEEKKGSANVRMGDDVSVLSLNPKIYPLDVIYSAAYIMIDKAFILLDGDPEERVCVEIRSKIKERRASDLVQEFNDELLNYSVYKVQSEKNAKLREIIMQRILLTNTQGSPARTTPGGAPEDFDPEGILKTWEEANKQAPPVRRIEENEKHLSK